MQQLSPASVYTYGIGPLMPEPSPLGRRLQRRRMELGIKTQVELSDITAQLGCRVPANTISRLESGATKGMRNYNYLNALAKALKLDSDLDLIVGAYAPGLSTDRPQEWQDDDMVIPSGPEGEIIALVRDRPDAQKRRALEVLRVMFADTD